MAFKAGNRVPYTNDGVPYVWGSGDVTTAPSNETKITASDAAGGDSFGSVAVGSGRIVVGAVGNEDAGSNSGSAYIYDLDGNEIAKITASDAAEFDFFGQSVSVGSGRIVVGAPNDDDNGSSSGSAYIYDLDGNELTKITASDGAEFDFFGDVVAAGSNRIVVSAPFDDDKGTNSGSVYIFDLDGNLITKITASDGALEDRFGSSVAVGSGRIVVGARDDDDNGSDSGSAYIFDLDGNLITKITASDGAASDNFGISVAVGSGRIVVGADGNDPDGSAYIFDLDGNEITQFTTSDTLSFGLAAAIGSGRICVGAPFEDTGAAYIFDLDGNEITKITASDGAADDNFSRSVAVGSGKIVVGARGDDPGGSAYIYDTPPVYTIYDAVEYERGNL